MIEKSAKNIHEWERNHLTKGKGKKGTQKTVKNKKGEQRSKSHQWMLTSVKRKRIRSE